jgi:anti-anti-sigma regulatory factor
MKKMKKITGILLLLVSFSGYSQVADSIAIKQTLLDYVEGYYTADWQRVSRAVHPELVKRIIIQDSSGLNAINSMGASTLILGAKRNKKPDGSLFKADISIYDIFKNTALAKVDTNKFPFIDYAQLGKINGEWKIINVLWAMR